MQKEIHPKYFPNATVTCACGNTFSIGSTKEKIDIEICSNCHPFYTGNEKIIDTAGRVERFKARRALAKPVTAKVKTVKKESKKENKKTSIKAKK